MTPPAYLEERGEYHRREEEEEGGWSPIVSLASLAIESTETVHFKLLMVSPCAIVLLTSVLDLDVGYGTLSALWPLQQSP